MSLSLVCQHLHPAIPALTVGTAISLTRSPDGAISFQVPGTHNVLARIVAAIRDGALVLTDPTDPVMREIEAQIMADRDRLLARADALLAQPPARPSLQAG